MPSTFRIIDGTADDRIPTVRELFLEYSAELDDDLCFQSFEEELAGLPGKYAPPGGAILLAEDPGSGVIAGIVALRPLREVSGACEMKRMYVRPAFRGSGLGRTLAEEVLGAAKGLGYSAMYLDTLDKLKPAIALYRSLGFEEIEPYYANPLEGVVYMRSDL